MSADRHAHTSAILLSGGRGSRLGGIEKGLAPLAGRPLISWVIHRIAAQVDEIVISANRQLNDYRALGHPVIADTLHDDQLSSFAGPLAGILAAAAHTHAEWLLVVPCDTPFLPRDLVARLHAASTPTQRLVRASDAKRIHYAVMLLHRSLLPDMADFLSEGQRSVQHWHARHPVAEASFADPTAFANLNTAEDFVRAEAAQR
ncbi:MAG: molybdenum cofactor guanylyltransferase [Betaproteobacteria bacterium]|jgi:molybdenum cofactor guanylyltransferase|nr:MAG: molybdenum cofactor guanylyltransferase [Betaproteobacteria bacterium]